MRCRASRVSHCIERAFLFGGTSMSYSDDLKNPKWQKKRLEILSRDNFTCKLCRDTETTLNVHHLEYIKGKKPWEHEDELLITYCEHCHAEIEILKKLGVKQSNIIIYKLINVDKRRLLYIAYKDANLNKVVAVSNCDSNNTIIVRYQMEYGFFEDVVKMCKKAFK